MQMNDTDIRYSFWRKGDHPSLFIIMIICSFISFYQKEKKKKEKKWEKKEKKKSGTCTFAA